MASLFCRALHGQWRTLPLLLLLAAAPPGVAGQPESAAFFRATRLVASAEDSGTGTGARIRTRETGFTAGFGSRPLAGGDLGVGLDYRYTRYELDGLDTRDWDLHWLRVPLEWQRASGGHRLIASLAPGVASSSNRFKEPGQYTRDDFDVAAQLLAIRRSSPGLSWTAGLAFDRRFGRARLYPVGGAIIEPGGAWMLRLVVPDPEIVFVQSPRLRWFASLAPAGHRWHAISEAAGRDFEFETRAWRAAVGGEVELQDWLSIRLFAGREFHRRYMLVDNAGSSVVAEAADGSFAGLSVAIPAFTQRRKP